MNEKRKRLLLKLEGLVGREFYNANIQNWGPGGVWEGEGRDFRFPITFVNAKGETKKMKQPNLELPIEVVKTGYYKLGANELHIIRALDEVLSYLEKDYDLNL